MIRQVIVTLFACVLFSGCVSVDEAYCDADIVDDASCDLDIVDHASCDADIVDEASCDLDIVDEASYHPGIVDKAFYQPDKVVYRTPAQDGFRYEEVRFESVDGTLLSGWFIPATTPALGTVIHFHGNAQNMTAHYSFVSWLPKSGFNLFVFDYRGYGASEGSPTRKGVYEDCVSAIKCVKSRDDIDQNKIIVIGQSLGGANAIAVIGKNSYEGIVGVVIDSAFSSYEKVANDHVAWFAKPLAVALVSDSYSPIDVVDRLSPIPLVIMHGTADQVVPFSHAEQLYEKAKEPKELWTIRNGRHTEGLSRYRSEAIPRLRKRFVEWLGAVPGD